MSSSGAGPLHRPPIAFAHRGASAHARENTMEAFVLARRLGATGVESDVWLTADGEPVLDHDGVVRRGVRRRRIADLAADQLPDHIAHLGQLYDEIGDSMDVSLDVKDPAAVEAVVAAARAAGASAASRLWLCHPDLTVTAGWRSLSGDVRLVDSTRLKRIGEGPERRAARLAELGVDAINLHHSDWNAGLVSLFHRFDVLAFGWDAQHAPALDRLVAIGIDAVYSDHVDRMVERLRRARPR